MSHDVTLSGAQRRSILSIKQTQKLSDRTQQRLTSGNKINGVVDDAVNFFRARALNYRAADFDLLRADIEQSMQTVQASLDALDAIDQLLGNLRGIVFSARSASKEERQSYNKQFNEILIQLGNVAQDASYLGTNLLVGTRNELLVNFGLLSQSRLDIRGVNLITTNVTAGNVSAALFSVNAFKPNNSAFLSEFLGATSFTILGGNNSNVDRATEADQIIRKATNRLRGHAARYGLEVAILQVREDFNSKYIDILRTGANNLKIADLNEEGANLVALQTRQQIGLQALAVSGQQQQAILTLLQ